MNIEKPLKHGKFPMSELNQLKLCYEKKFVNVCGYDRTVLLPRS